MLSSHSLLLALALTLSPVCAVADVIGHGLPLSPKFGNYRGCIAFSPASDELAPEGRSALRLPQTIEPSLETTESLWLRMRSGSDTQGTQDWRRIWIVREAIAQSRPHVVETYQELSLVTGTPTAPFPCPLNSVFAHLTVSPPVAVNLGPASPANLGQLTCVECNIVCLGSECSFRP
jgi:hypothetical protein